MATAGPRTIVELCPPNSVPNHKGKGVCRAWWESPDILESIEWLKLITSIKKYVCVEVDDTGNISKVLT
jgi:hypothetical protein